MKLAKCIMELGRCLAYYPDLKKITKSTTSSILLCQFLYWTPKAKDGWIYKNSNEIEEETGLTHNEQRTAKRILIELKLITKEVKRLDHTSRYRVNQDEMNRQWESLSGKGFASFESEEHLDGNPTLEDVVVTAPAVIEKRGDLLDGIMHYTESPLVKKMNGQNEIRLKIEKRLNINPKGKRWQEFINFAYKRQAESKEEVDIFLIWALEEGFNPIYWTPEKMETLWPRAFAPKESDIREANFIEKLPEIKTEEDYVDMPKELGRKQELY
jgi:hypothetical protein